MEKRYIDTSKMTFGKLSRTLSHLTPVQVAQVCLYCDIYIPKEYLRIAAETAEKEIDRITGTTRK